MIDATERLVKDYAHNYRISISDRERESTDHWFNKVINDLEIDDTTERIAQYEKLKRVELK